MTDTKDDEYFRQERRDVEALIPANALKILDVGCGEGLLGQRLLDKGAREVVGIEIAPEVSKRAGKNLTQVLHGNIEEMELAFDKGYFDCMIFADVLEHLKDPLLTLKKLRQNLSDSGVVVASIPNVGYLGILNMLAQGHWSYQDHGILDRTHLRFFTRKEILTLFKDAGFEITAMSDNINPAYDRLTDLSTGEINFGRVTLRGLTPEEMRDLFVIQYIVRAQKAGASDAGNRSMACAEKITTKAMKKVAIVRGANLNKWEMQNYEPLTDRYDITAYTTNRHAYDTTHIKMQIAQLPSRAQGLLAEMEGLEEQLADKDLVFSADITYRFSAQAVEAKKRYGCKVVCLEWENIPFNYEEFESVLQIKQEVRKGADHFIAVTERAKEALMLEGVQEARIDVVPMGVDLNVFRPAKEDIEKDRASFGIGRDEIVVLFIGRMVWEKGIYDFLHAAARVLADDELKKHSIRFLIVGKGQEMQGARARVWPLGIAAWTTFVEEYPYHDMYRLHNLADIFVLPSISTKGWQEQFGMVLIESMACGTPVISTLSGSIPEVVGDAGILVQPNDHMSLCSAMKKLIIDNPLRERLGEEGLKRARTHFDAQKNSEKFGRVFEKVMSAKSAEDAVTGRYKEGLDLWKEGRKAEGFEQVCKVFSEDTERKDILDSIVEMGRELKKYEAVEKYLREYLISHPANLDVLTSLSEILLLLGNPEQAEEELRKVFIFDPENVRALSIMEEIKNVTRSAK